MHCGMSLFSDNLRHSCFAVLSRRPGEFPSRRDSSTHSTVHRATYLLRRIFRSTRQAGRQAVTCSLAWSPYANQPASHPDKAPTSKRRRRYYLQSTYRRVCISSAVGGMRLVRHMLASRKKATSNRAEQMIPRWKRFRRRNATPGFVRTFRLESDSSYIHTLL